MSVSDKQQNILEAIRTIAKQEVNRSSGPIIEVGVVVGDPQGYECIVEIQGTEKTCVLPEHLHDWISKDDIVFVTDTNGNGANLVVTGSSGSKRDQTLVVNDESKNRLVGGVTKFEQDNFLTDEEIRIN